MKSKYPKTGLFSKENLDRIQFKNLAWFEYINYEFLPFGKIKFNVCFNAWDRDTGKKRHFIVSSPIFSRSKFKSTLQIANKIRSLAKFYVKHEIDECFHFDNERIYDPHR